MAKRRNSKREESLAVVLMDLPWQVSVIVAAFAFVVMRWIIPMQAKSPILLPLATMVSGFAPIVAIFFLCIGGISFFKNRSRAAPTLNKYPSAQINPAIKHTISNRPSLGTRANITENNTSALGNQTIEHTLTVIPSDPNLGMQTTGESTKPKITEWSLDLLKVLEWKRFEMLCAEYFRVLGKRVETIAQGADGGIDARIYKKDSDVLEFAIQCKSWNSIVGVKHVRELFGVMAHESAGKGIFMTTSWFSDDAKQFAAEHKDKLFLLDGEKFISMISNLPDEKRKIILEFSTEGDYTTPTCASCGIKMIQRPGKGGDFWGCLNFPRCRSTLKIATA